MKIRQGANRPIRKKEGLSKVIEQYNFVISKNSTDGKKKMNETSVHRIPPAKRSDENENGICKRRPGRFSGKEPAVLPRTGATTGVLSIISN